MRVFLLVFCLMEISGRILRVNLLEMVVGRGMSKKRGVFLLKSGSGNNSGRKTGEILLGGGKYWPPPQDSCRYPTRILTACPPKKTPSQPGRRFVL